MTQSHLHIRAPVEDIIDDRGRLGPITDMIIVECGVEEEGSPFNAMVELPKEQVLGHTCRRVWELALLVMEMSE